MLRQRIVTALILLAVLLPALFAPSPWPFAWVSLAMIGAAGWEWGRLNGASPAVAVGMGALVALAGLAALAAGWVERAPDAVWWLTLAVWLVAGPLALRAGPSAWPKGPVLLRRSLGLLLFWAAWLALAHARQVGIHFVLSLLCLVWAADIAAYAGGRAFGRRKLAPTISPGKSWEGVWSGVVGVLLLAAAWAAIEGAAGASGPSFYSTLVRSFDIVGAAVALVALAGLSVMGDLLESLVKRAAGVKDSSGLLPGHGGVLDRVDALLPVLPAALAIVALGTAG